MTANVRVVGVQVSLTLTSTAVRVGDKVKAQAKVANTGPARLTALTVELRLPATGLVVSGSTVTTIARLQPGQVATTSWTICAAQPGNYLLLARVTVDGAVVESAAHLLSVSGPSRRRGC
ncbi:MAG TPA: CARDB domain-containing protein [Candidatus Limnocylindrales bacterium]|nr:CARDB domain-containing protein [Candidatus Limnocylindrales bacterium]